MLGRTLVVLVLALGGSPAVYAELATERYAPAQILMAQEMLERARAAATLGDTARAGKLAWQASLDARLAWAMTESAVLRADAAKIGGAALKLNARLAGRPLNKLRAVVPAQAGTHVLQEENGPPAFAGERHRRVVQSAATSSDVP